MKIPMVERLQSCHGNRKMMFVHNIPITLSSSCLESDSCEQKVNKHELADSEAYFGLKIVIDA